MPTNRRQDEKLLGVVRARAGGLSLTKIADRFGSKSGPISKQTNAVMDADLAHSTTENPRDVAAAYWPRTNGGKKNA